MTEEDCEFNFEFIDGLKTDFVAEYELTRKEFDGTKVRKIRLWDDEEPGYGSFGFQLFDASGSVLAQTDSYYFNDNNFVYTDVLLNEKERIVGVKSRKDNIFACHDDLQFVIGWME